MTDAQEEEAPDAGGGSKVCGFPEGAYQLHVLVETGKNLDHDCEDTVDPLIKVKFMGMSKTTASKSKITKSTLVTWDEHLFFDTPKLEVSEIESAIIEIEILNKGFFSSDLIGRFPVSATTIYNLDKHTLHNQMLSFTNPEAENKTKITGNISVSIQLAGPGDESLQLKIGTDKNAATKKPWMPPSVKKKYKQLSIKIIKAKNVPKVTLMGVETIPKPYVNFNIMGNDLRTTTQTMQKEVAKKAPEEFEEQKESEENKNEGKPTEEGEEEKEEEEESFDPECTWNQEMLVPLEIPLTKDQLTFGFYHEQPALIPDTLMSQMNLSAKEILKTDSSRNKDGSTNFVMKWVNLYGCNPVHGGGKHADLQNANPDKATTFKGCLLIEYWTRDVKHPEMKIKDISEIGELDDPENKMSDFQERLAEMTERKYNCAFEIGAGIALPNSKDYYVKVAIGEDQWDTEGPKQGQSDGYKNYCRWSHKERNKEFRTVHKSLKFFPKLFIYLMQKGTFGGGTPICYFVDDVENYTDHNAKLKWVQLTADPAIGEVKQEWDAGFIQFRLYIHDTHLKGEYVGSEYEKPWKKQPRQRLTVHRVRCFLYQAFNLPPMDDTGASDPLVRVWNTKGEKIETPYNEQTNNPIFYCTKDVEMEFDHLDDAPPIILDVVDLDFMCGMVSNEDFIGRAVVFLKDVKFCEDDNIPKPQWFPVTNRLDDAWDPESGPQLLASFAKKDTSKIDDDYELDPEEILLDQVVKLKSTGLPIRMPSLNIQGFNIEIMVLGLRDLVSTGLLPIKKAFVKFSVKSLLPPAAAKAVQEIFTEPKEGGDDPNIKTTLKFLVRIPGEPQYMPRMTCTIFDKLYFEGMAQPILGTFVLKLGDALRDTRLKDRYTVEEIINLARIIDKATQLKKGAGAGNTLLQNINKVQEEEATDQVEPEEVKINVDANAALGPLEDIESMDPDEQMEYIQRLELRKQRLLEKQTFMREQDLKRQKEIEARKKAEEAIADNKDAVHNVIYPKYKWDERLGIDREDQIPDNSLFVEVGYNRAPRDGMKHYRRYYTKELEKMTDLMPPSPFLSVPAYRTKKDDGLFGTGEVQSVQTGRFKGLVKVFREEFRIKRDQLIEENFQKLYQVVEAAYKAQMILPSDEPFDFDWKQLQDLDNATEAFEKLKELCFRCGLSKLGVHTIIKNYNFDINLQKKLETVAKAKVRIYMLEGFNFAQKSMFSPSDPFLIISCGKTIFNERENYQLNTASPQFYKSYDMNIELPGAPVLRIEALDYDDFFGDDLIGVTKIDIDDRFYNKEWSTIEHKPVEQRSLYHPDSTFSQGVVKLWMELYKSSGTKSVDPPKAIDITPEPVIEYEMRLVIWKTKDVLATDFEQTSDHYIRCYVNPDESHYTDTHWRCHTGKGSFNWRNLIKVPTKEQQYQLTVQLWDKDIISSDDLLGEFTLDIGPMFEDVQALNKKKVFNEKYWKEYMEEELINRGCDNTVDLEWDDDEDEKKKKDGTREQFWIPMRRANNKPEEGPEEYKDLEEIEAGFVLCSFSIIPPEDAEQNPQGVGREGPNNDPFCPEPEGRMQLSLNPFAMLEQMVNPKLLAKIKMGCGGFLCCIVCCGLCMVCFPFIGIFL